MLLAKLIIPALALLLVCYNRLIRNAWKVALKGVE
jgi:hypothetical protein